MRHALCVMRKRRGGFGEQEGWEDILRYAQNDKGKGDALTDSESQTFAC